MNGVNYEVLYFKPSPFPIGPNIGLRILFSNNVSLGCSHNLRDHVLETNSTIESIIVLYVSIFSLKDEDRSVWAE